MQTRGSTGGASSSAAVSLAVHPQPSPRLSGPFIIKLLLQPHSSYNPSPITMPPSQLLIRHPCGALCAVPACHTDTVADVSWRAFPEAAAAAEQGLLRFQFHGRTLQPSTRLAAAGLLPGGMLELLPRLLGGGGDGGSTGAESRSCYLEMYMGKRADKVDPEEERLARWTTCQLSGMPLQPPCVADELGSFFNKDAVLQALLNKTMPKALSHITNLKHLIELKLERASSSGGGHGGGGCAPAQPSEERFVCPVTGQPFSGKHKFVVLRGSGHVVSVRALKELPAVVEELVGGKWKPADLLTVNPSGQELEQLRIELFAKRAHEKAAKRERNKGNVASGVAPSGDAAALQAVGGKRAAGAAPTDEVPVALGLRAANGTVDVPACKRFKVADLKPKNADDKVWNSLFTSSSAGGSSMKANDFMCRAAMRRVA